MKNYINGENYRYNCYQSTLCQICSCGHNSSYFSKLIINYNRYRIRIAMYQDLDKYYSFSETISLTKYKSNLICLFGCNILLHKYQKNGELLKGRYMVCKCKIIFIIVI